MHIIYLYAHSFFLFFCQLMAELLGIQSPRHADVSRPDKHLQHILANAIMAVQGRSQHKAEYRKGRSWHKADHSTGR